VFAAANRFRVIPSETARFEAAWLNRESHIQSVPGFLSFYLLRAPAAEDHVLYSSFTLWRSRADFEAWTKSDAFRRAHATAGEAKPMSLGHPQFEGFEGRAIKLPRRSLAPLLVALAAVPARADDPPTDIPNPTPPARLVALLRGGGLVLYIRHTTTQREGADQVSAVMGDCATQRMLGEEGWREARAIGAAMRRLNIPVGTVISSEYCRAWQTADLAFGRYRKNAALNFEPAEEYSEAQEEAMRARVRPLLSAVPRAGTNTVLVGHDDPFEAATGIYPEPMGVTWVVRPRGGQGFTLLGQIRPDDWARLR
jgi:heme-degrading monooxygenase HmoA/phosphohistidine phosphatase SixA